MLNRVHELVRENTYGGGLSTVELGEPGIVRELENHYTKPRGTGRYQPSTGVTYDDSIIMIQRGHSTKLDSERERVFLRVDVGRGCYTRPG